MIVFSLPVTTLVGTAADLSANPGQQAWILSAMSVGAASGLLVSGSLGDNFGRGRVFMYGLFLLAASSLIAALSPTAILLIGARLLQGMAGAAVMACSLGLVGQFFERGSERAHATGVWAAAFGAGVTTGPILAAGLEDLLSWRAAYWVSFVLAILLLQWAKRAIPLQDAHPRRSIDLSGALTLAMGVGCFLAGLTESRLGLGSPEVTLLFCLAVLFISIFVWVEKQSRAPLIALSLFKKPGFLGATLGAFFAGAGVLGLLTLVPTLLQTVYKTSSFTSSLVLQAWSATSVLTAFGVRWLSPTWTAERLLVFSLVGCGIGQLALGVLGENSSYLIVLPGLLVAGAANGVLNAALGRLAIETVPSTQVAMGSGANNTARYIGSAFGLTLVSIFLAGGAARGGESGMLDGWYLAVWVTTAFSIVGAGLIWCIHYKKDREGVELDDE